MFCCFGCGAFFFCIITKTAPLSCGSVGALSNLGGSLDVAEIDLLPEDSTAIKDKDGQSLSLTHATRREEERSAKGSEERGTRSA